MHQPINSERKDLEFVQSMEGSIGLEASFRVLRNQFPLEKVIDILTRGKKRFGIENPAFKEGIPADLSLFSPNNSGTLKAEDLYSTSKNCMFIGTPTKGIVYGCIRGENNQLNS
jgi:dihydroorotase